MVNDVNVEMARQCLKLIRDIADRGAWSPNSGDVGYALQELSQVLWERTGTASRFFHPVPAEQLQGLSALRTELEWVEGFSADMQQNRLA